MNDSTTRLAAQPPARAARELDSRTSDGIHVRLLWHPSQDRVSVAVEDTKCGERFELAVQDRRLALDVFHHPFAYAAGSDHDDKDEPAFAA